MVIKDRRGETIYEPMHITNPLTPGNGAAACKPGLGFVRM